MTFLHGDADLVLKFLWKVLEPIKLGSVIVDRFLEVLDLFWSHTSP